MMAAGSRRIDVAGHSVSIARNYPVRTDRHHRLDVDGRSVALLTDDEADAIAVLIRLADEALSLRSLGPMGEAS